jgi:hypothetical protein
MAAGRQTPLGSRPSWKCVTLVREEKACIVTFKFQCDGKNLVFVIVNIDSPTCQHLRDIWNVDDHPAEPDGKDRFR